MPPMDKTLLVTGLLFPSISLLSGLISLFSSTREKHVSPVFVPLVGPTLLSWWIAREGITPWAFPVVWICDIGTVAFLCAAPPLFRDFWQTSAFTRRELFWG